MGTTATVAGVWRDRLYLAQIGDSRGYLMRDGVARQLTRDQSLTQRLVEVGELTEEVAEASERRNIILQALGPDPKVKVDLSWQQLQRGDVLLICSDGLSTVVRRDEMAEAVNEDGDVRQVAERLVALANANGGPDNITIVVVRFDGDGLPERAPDEPGYHEYPQADERPSLQPTAAFPAATPPAPMPAPERRGSPTGLALAALAVVMTILGIVILLNR
jgi:protein phosphatase